MLIQELGRGKYSDCFKVWERDRAVCLKISYYGNSTIRAFARHAQHGNRGAAHEAKDQDAISVSMAMAEVARQMHLFRVSPHFVKVYCEADIRCLPVRLKPLLRERLPRLTARQLKYSHVCLMDLYSCNLSSFLARPKPPSDATLRALLFQVVYTLACMQLVFPGFRHNDLSTNNVLVKPSSHASVTYCVGNASFRVTSPYTAALADFDFTHVPGHDVLANERVLSGKYGITQHPNASYDVHLLLKTMHRILRRRGVCPETRRFVHRLKLNPSRDRVDAPLRHVVPHELLFNPYFAPLRCAHGERASPDACFAMPTA